MESECNPRILAASTSPILLNLNLRMESCMATHRALSQTEYSTMETMKTESDQGSAFQFMLTDLDTRGIGLMVSATDKEL